MKEYEGDQYLNIATEGTQWISEATLHHNRYEPTPYIHLKELFNRHPLNSDDGLVDFGCGKGRLNFYVHDRFSCRATGVELNTSFCGEAQQNLENYSRISRHRKAAEYIRFRCGMAQDYDVQPQDTVFYFFNPFSVQIFMKVVDNILKSAETYPRDMKIILYYPTREYINFLERNTVFELLEEIGLPAINKNPAEQFLVYSYSPQMI
ncbi:class I SAM-dependent methyltransferase [Planomicrobium sp. Y74]|uniref:SAM-dependent methyltransferase n=1 Tax=Planomicrobium sp. Y74 TaxID=2478977 RepID=UPI000EF521E1|nr:class I SAM-dependent methyltransferase [Planomicrobium sp. Y74]RLQ90290.1 class I SAM-dependent methyltransferase [Planomicrobium sp. Y74]